MKNKVEKELKKKNKVLYFGELFKNLISGSQEELTQEQVIMNDSSLTMQEKKLLIECLKREENRAKKMNIDEVVYSQERKIFGTIRNSKGVKNTPKKENNQVNINIDEDLTK